jgi:ribosomal protein L16 Arg81 hydroxylase
MLEFGFTPQEFRSSYLELRPYVQKAALKELTTQWSDLDALLYGVSPDETLQLFNNGQVPPQAYIDDIVELGRPRRRISKQRFYGLMQAGATLVLNRIEGYSVPAKRLCAEVGRFVGCQTTSNAYVSFGGKGTFGKHWDTHDVFAIQLIGKKRWQIFAPTLPLPLSHQTSEALRHTCPAAPTMECVLEAGDMLYIPRGWWHQVTPFDVGSWHLSVGAYLPTVTDYIMWLTSRYLSTQLPARGGLIDDATALNSLPALLRGLGDALQDQRALDEFKRDLRARERLTTEFDTNLFLGKDQTALDSDTRLSLTSSHAYGHQAIEIPVNGGRLKLEPLSRAIVGLLSDATSLTFAELCQRVPQIPVSVVRSAVLDLAVYEVLSLTSV